MFICKECAKKYIKKPAKYIYFPNEESIEDYFEMKMMISYGPYEDCGTVTKCLDI